LRVVERSGSLERHRVGNLERAGVGVQSPAASDREALAQSVPPLRRPHADAAPVDLITPESPPVTGDSRHPPITIPFRQ
jgi:hypothetical protein